MQEFIDWLGSLARWAGDAVALAFLGSPFETKPRQVAELDYPGNDVSSNHKLVIENCFLIHWHSPFRPGWRRVVKHCFQEPPWPPGRQCAGSGARQSNARPGGGDPR